VLRVSASLQTYAYQLIGGGGAAVISTVLPGPDVVEEMIGPNSPHSPNSGTVTVALNAKLRLASAFVGC
jgi:hypothetical protein